MEIVKVIALDPGGTTGWAKGLIRDGKMYVVSGQDEWDHFDIFKELSEVTKPDIIVCERFDYRKGGRKQEGVELISREYIGVVRLYALMFPNTPNGPLQLYMQMPSEGVGGYWKEDAQLKKDGVFMIGKPHANDAMRHLLQWYTFKEGYIYNKEGFTRMDSGAAS